MMTSGFRGLAMLAIGGLSACATLAPPQLVQESANRDWAPMLSRARTLATAGQAAQADSLLDHYASTYPGAPQSIEARYWRAVLNLRATNQMQASIPLLQSYVAVGRSTEHWMEADALLRAVARVDTLSRVAATYMSRGDVATDAAAAANARIADAKADVKAATADTKAQDDEIKRLKDELAKSKDELDRIKKRLAEPPKRPPR